MKILLKLFNIPLIHGNFNMFGEFKVRFLYLSILLLLLLACHDYSSNNVNIINTTGRNYYWEDDFGWRAENFLTEEQADKNSRTLERIFLVNNKIVITDYHCLYDAYNPFWIKMPVVNAYVSEIGDSYWKKLNNPEKITCFYGDSTGLYAGTRYTGKVYKYDFDENKWDEIFALKFDSTGMFNVSGITVYKGKPVISFAGFNDMADTLNVKDYRFVWRYQNPVIMMQTDTGWVDITYRGNTNSGYPMRFHRGVEFKDALYVATEHNGIWRYNGTWKEVARIPIGEWSPLTADDVGRRANGIVVHKDKIYAFGDGISTHLVEYDELNDVWNPVDSIFDSLGVIYRNTPSEKWALASNGKHLFHSGSTPLTPLYL